MSDIVYSEGRKKFVTDTGNIYYLPAPFGINRENLEQYDFTPTSKKKYTSEGEKIIEIAVRFIFKASLMWEPLPIKELNKLFKLQQERVFTYYPFENSIEGLADISFRVKISQLSHNYLKGFTIEETPGYTVKLLLEGMELLKTTGWGFSIETTGFGTGYGLDTENQSP